jgi:hypothetical protein
LINEVVPVFSESGSLPPHAGEGQIGIVSRSFPIALSCQIKELVLDDFYLRVSHLRSGKPIKKINQRVNRFHTLLCSGYAPQNARVFGRLNSELDHSQRGNHRRGCRDPVEAGHLEAK